MFCHADRRDIDPFFGRDGLRQLIEQHGLMPWLAGVRDRLRVLFETREAWSALEEHFTPDRVLEEGCKLYVVHRGRSPQFAIGWRWIFS